MDNKSRRGALQLFGLGAAVIGSAQARAQQLAQASPNAPPTGSQTTQALVTPGELVNGTYEASFQEGYASALLSVGFSETSVFRMFLSGSQRMSIFATDKALLLRTKREGAEQQIALNVPVATEVFGVRIQDWLARFESPTRLAISFSAPNHTRVQAIQTFYPEGYVTRLSIEGAPQFTPIRVWTRVAPPQEGRQRPKAYLVPL